MLQMLQQGDILEYSIFFIQIPFSRWLLEKNNVPSVVFGVKSLDQLEDNLGAVGWKMPTEDLEELDSVSSIPEPYPYEMINRLNINRKR